MTRGSWQLHMLNLRLFLSSQTLLEGKFPNIVSKICNIGSKIDFNGFGV